MRTKIGQETKEVDVMEYISRLALELISQAGFGTTFNTIEGKDDGYCLAVKQVVFVVLAAFILSRNSRNLALPPGNC
jgi:hypothetical protein